MRAGMIAVEGRAAEWDHDDQEEFRALAGPRFLRVEGDTAVVLSDGREQPVYPGWFVIVAEDGQPVFASPARVRVVSGDAAEG
jgi:hypothetical protein